jgi:hypothetical protein
LKNIVVSIPNSLLAGGIVMQLKKSNFRVYREDDPRGIEDFCIGADLDVLLVEVREQSPYTLAEWLERYEAIKKRCEYSRFVVIVDENTSPELAEQVTRARNDLLIDAFLYSSVTGEYLSAVVDSL